MNVTHTGSRLDSKATTSNSCGTDTTPSLTLTLFKNVTIDAVGEFQKGGHLLNGTGFQNAGLGIWQPCFAAQKALRAAAAGDASALASVNAQDRMRCKLLRAAAAA